MQGRSLRAHAQYDTASALGLFQPECIAGGGVLRKCRGDYSMHIRNRQPQRRRRLLTSYVPSPTVSLWEQERELRLCGSEKKPVGKAESMDLEWSQVADPRFKH